MGSTDFHLGDRIRVFVQLQSGTVFGRNGGPRPSQDQDTLDVSQAFAGFTVIRGKEKPKLKLEIGRQELNYGEGSLLAIRELNVRRPFDVVKAIIRPGDWGIDLLAFRPALIKTGAFDDGIDSSQALWGAWATRPIKNRSFWRQVDFYYLGLMPSPTVSLTATHLSFWRTSLAGGIYSQPGFFLRRGNENLSRYVGSLQDLAITWRVDRHTTFQALGTYYEVGAFLKETSPPGRNLFYFSLKMNYRF
jgi:hypothetical protein